jgi:hypothetical protein
MWRARLQLAQRRTVWCPTLSGWLFIVILLITPIAWWCTYGESYLSLTDRLPAEVLVVEGWIGPDAVRAAATEFRQHGYDYVVVTGGMTISERWEHGGGSYAEGAGQELIRSGIPTDRITVAPSGDTENQRTFESAVAVWRALHGRSIHPRALNVFTWGPHARRSRLIFAKVCRPGTVVGVVSWMPLGYKAVPWWTSSDRARELLTESAGYLFEALLNSNRKSNSPALG